MTSRLTPVGCIGLFGSGPTSKKRGAHPSCASSLAPAGAAPPHNHLNRPQRNAGRHNPPGAHPSGQHGGIIAQVSRDATSFFCEAQCVRRAGASPSTLRATQAAERPASPARAHLLRHSLLRMASNLIAGRVHSVVRRHYDTCSTSPSSKPTTTPEAPARHEPLKSGDSMNRFTSPTTPRCTSRQSVPKLGTLN